MVLEAKTAISDGDNTELAMDGHPDRAQNYMQTMDVADALMFRPTAAKTLLSLFQEQVKKWEKSDDFKLNKDYDADAIYESLKAGHALGGGWHADAGIRQTVPKFR
jgi:hypothetical protein